VTAKSKADRDHPWIMVRIQRTTHARLRAYGAASMGSGTLDPGSRGNFGELDEPSLDAVIVRLLDLDARKRERANESARNLRRRRRAADTEESGEETE
jgi:hypothetical protein